MSSRARIDLGTLAAGGDLQLDVATLVDSRALITGNSGAGKSRLLRRLAEQASGKVQIVLFDSEGEFDTLRDRHPFLLAGRGGEVPAEPRSAGLLARRLMELHVSAVLDLYDLKLDQQREFVRVFVEALLELPKDLYSPVLVAIDEAHKFCPEKGSGEASSTSAVISLMSQGRKRGLCGIPATQRLSKLHKDAAAEANNIFIGRTTLDVDQKRSGDALGMSKADALALRDLDNGFFHAYGPALVSQRGVVLFRGGEVFTRHPKAGERHKLDASPAPEAIRRLAGELADLPQQAAEEIRTIEAAQARIRDLERQLKAGPKPAPAPTPKERSVIKPADLKHLDAAAAALDVAQRKFMDDAMAQLRASIERVDIILTKGTDALAQKQQVVVSELGLVRHQIELVSAPVVAPPPPRPAPTPSPLPLPRAPRVAGEKPAQAGALGVPHVRILMVLYAHRDRAVTREELGVRSVYRYDSGHFGNVLSELRTQGLVVTEGAGYRITMEGGAALRAVALLPMIRPLKDWLAKLDGASRKTLEAIVKAGEVGLTREQAGDAVGLRSDSGHFGNTLSALRSNGLITGAKGAPMRAHAALLEDHESRGDL